jgi:GNAT superfamily N-acetyltransferase
MVLAKTPTGHIQITTRTIFNKDNADDPFFIFTPHVKKPPKIWLIFPPIPPSIVGDLCYRIATPADLDIIREFTDFWLSGKGYAAKVPGAGRDYFIPTGQHIDYLKYYTTLLAFRQSKIVGWAVRQRDGTLIHLLVASNCRGQGIGAHLLELLEPPTIRSKSDQSTGDPLDFYLKHGFKKTSDVKIGKHKNIDILTRDTSKKTPELP